MKYDNDETAGGPWLIDGLMPFVRSHPEKVNGIALNGLIMEIHTEDLAAYRRGEAYLRGNNPILLPICLNNGYYNKKRIAGLICIACAMSDDVRVFLTDGPSIHNYKAAGYSDKIARQKIKSQKNRLLNHCQRGINLFQRICGTQSSVISFYDWDSIYDSEDYSSARQHLTNLYSLNPSFSGNIREATIDVLSRRLGLSALKEECVDTGINYTLDELAFILSSRKIPAKQLESRNISVGGHRMIYVYHERWFVLEKLLGGFYDDIPRLDIGYCRLSCSNKSDKYRGGAIEY